MAMSIQKLYKLIINHIDHYGYNSILITSSWIPYSEITTCNNVLDDIMIWRTKLYDDGCFYPETFELLSGRIFLVINKNDKVEILNTSPLIIKVMTYSKLHIRHHLTLQFTY